MWAMSNEMEVWHFAFCIVMALQYFHSNMAFVVSEIKGNEVNMYTALQYVFPFFFLYNKTT
jgi:hypothetical protein